MSLDIRKLKGAFGVEIINLDLKQSLNYQTKVDLNKAFVENVVLCIRNQNLKTPEDFLLAANQFGEPMKQVVATYRLKGYEDIEVLSNRQTDERSKSKKLMRRGGTWHTDHSNVEIPPKATMLYAIAIPDTGGDTQFCNMHMAYDGLKDEMKKKLKGLKAFHSYLSSRAPRKLLERNEKEKKESNGVWQPLVRIHPDTNRKSLYLNQMRIEHVEGMGHEEGFDFMDELYSHCEKSEYHYSHKWKLGDVLIWDDRSSLHHATFDFDQTQLRYMHRAMLKGERPILA